MYPTLCKTSLLKYLKYLLFLHRVTTRLLNITSYFLLRAWRSLFQRREGLIRLLLCFLIGLLTLQRDEHQAYDRRFNLRGEQAADPNIVVLTINLQDFSMDSFRSLRTRAQFEDLADLTDHIFWSQKIWFKILSKILEQNPKSIAISLLFDDVINSSQFTKAEKLIFKDPRIVWSHSTPYNSLTDEDGQLRRVSNKHTDPILQLIEQTTDLKMPHFLFPPRINFRGPPQVFTHLRVSQLEDVNLPSDFFKNKIVIIGAESNPKYLTPTGPHNRAEILAQISDNFLNHRWILRASDFWYALFLMLILLLSVYVIYTYPQTVALFVLLWIGVFIASVSVWIFDTYYIWIPIFSPIVTLVVCWIVFIGYQADQSEKLNWKLRQEQKYFHELEQLKNNFVSLISHDLKTPIAKIQAVVDRLLFQKSSMEDPLHSDLTRLRSYSNELNRYIQSILSLLRVESKDFHLNKEICDINELIDEAVESLKPLAQNKHQTLFTQQEPLFTIEADPTLIKEVIINIIENAIKYSTEGGLISVESFEKNDEVHVRIKDNGPGIHPEDLQILWQKFTRGKDQDLKTKGTGLGLYLVKYFIELHGGKVTLESQINVGTTLHFSLPIEGAL